MNEPVPVIPLEYAAAAPRPTVARRICKWGSVIAWAMCLGAWLAIWLWDVESVLLSGPLVAAAGVCLMIAGRVAGHGFAMFVGACYCAITLLLFGLVQIMNWGPDSAEQPFTILGGLFTLIIAAPTAWVFLLESGCFRRDAGA